MPAMRFSAATLLVTALGWFSAATAHTIQLKAHSRECFHEALHKDDVMTVTFQVGDREFGGSGNLDIDFWVCNFLSLFFCRVLLIVYPSWAVSVSETISVQWLEELVWKHI